MAALVIAEHDNASIKGATLNTVTAAAQCGGDVHVLVAGHNAGAAAAAAAQIAGVSKVIHVEGEHFAHGLAENMAAQVLAIASGYSHILFPATASGKNIAPRVAAKLDVGQVSDITKVESPDTFERPIYAGNAIAYHELFKETQARRLAADPSFRPLNIACVFSPPAEGDKDVQRLKTRLDQYTDLTEVEQANIAAVMPEDQLKAFRGAYLETARRLKARQGTGQPDRLSGATRLRATRRALPPRAASTVFATPPPRTCSKPALICSASAASWAMAICRRPRGICIWRVRRSPETPPRSTGSRRVPEPQG